MVARSLLIAVACAAVLPQAALAGAPTGLRVVDLRASGAALTWEPATGGAQVYGYSIRDLLGPATGNQVGYSFSTTGTATLQPRTTYRLAVQAQLIVDGWIVDSPFSNAVTVTTPPDTTPPTQPTARADGQTATSVALSFGGATDDVGIEHWIISNGEQTWTQAVSRPWRASVAGLETNRAHTFTVRARDAAGNLSPPSAPVTFELENSPPTAPANLRVEGDELVWDASQDNVGVARYEVFVDGDPVVFARPAVPRTPLRICDDDINPSFCHPALGEPHTYVVRARDHSMNLSPPSAPLTVPPS